jgi:Tfp pilus assembly protein PilV
MSTHLARLGVPRRRRGVSLIEALVAMAVMAFGMLGVVGLQATLRAKADLAKQRTEATRLAQEKIEAWRSYSVIPTTAGAKSYAAIADATAETLTSFVSNTTYTRTVDVTESSPAGSKTMVVDVSWSDRTGNTHNVRLFSAAAEVAPGLAATLVAAPQGAGGMREPEGRRRGVPPQAKNFGDGTSGFRPPQAVGGTVAWLFNNTTGLITSICSTTVTDNSALVRTDLVSCNSTTPHQFFGGFIRFLTGTTPTAANVLDPVSPVSPPTIAAQVLQTAPAAFAGTVACFHGVATAYVQYFCAVPVEAPSPPSVPVGYIWSGSVRIDPVSLPTISGSSADATSANRKVCRYRVDAAYTDVNGPLGNQNLLVIQAGNGTTAYACPDPPVAPATVGPGPTWPHQPPT